ncbi:MAG TPA: hypothetical protein PLJ35_15915 [Anaerolineae bacterium]|nr:hypothetical protein [Anaerolineae bacterium]HPL27055.1 hypothetical protein [Anaerolineae bacterium]
MRQRRTVLLVVVALLAVAGAALGVLTRRAPSTAPSATGTLAPVETPAVTPTPTATPRRRPSGTVTATRVPTKTPRPPRPISKIGPEISGGTHVALGTPPVVKLRNISAEYVGQARQEVGSECLIVVRFEFDEPDQAHEPVQAAREWFDRRRGDMLEMKAAGGPNIAFETGANEVGDSGLDWYVAFSLELIPRMHADGLRCVAGNPAMGTWNEQNWPRFAPVIAILTPDDLLGLHEYWASEAQIDDRWYCGRWSIPEIAAVIGNTKIVITECGRDIGWAQMNDAEQFLYELEKYDILLNQYPNVVGATAFTIDANWGDYNVFDIWPQVVYRYSLTPTPQPGR